MMAAAKPVGRNKALVKTIRNNSAAHGTWLQRQKLTGNQTRAQVNQGLGTVGQVLLGELAEGSLSNLLVDDELGDGVGDLLQQDGTETGVESTDTLGLQHLAETTDQAGSVGGLRNQTDTGSLQGALVTEC